MTWIFIILFGSRYMKHAYGLGEHYNSVKPLSDMTPDNEC